MRASSSRGSSATRCLSGWHGHDVGAEAVIEIIAKQPFDAQFVQGPIGGRDDPALETSPFVAAHRSEGALLQYLEQLDLYRDGDVSDFIQKD